MSNHLLELSAGVVPTLCQINSLPHQSCLSKATCMLTVCLTSSVCVSVYVCVCVCYHLSVKQFVCLITYGSAHAVGFCGLNAALHGTTKPNLHMYMYIYIYTYVSIHMNIFLYTYIHKCICVYKDFQPCIL